MVKFPLVLAASALAATSFVTPAQSLPNFQNGTPIGLTSCSQVAPPSAFKRIAPKDSPTVTAKICYLTSAETFWPSRYNIDEGYLYLVRGVAYRIRALTESECNDRPRDRKRKRKYQSGAMFEIQPSFGQAELMLTGGGYKKKIKKRNRGGCNEGRRGRGRGNRD